MSEEGEDPGGQEAPGSDTKATSETMNKVVETYKEVTTAVPKRKGVINNYI